MGWWPCPDCCMDGCAIFSGEFDVPDSDDLGSNWVEGPTGNWRTASSYLVEDGTAGAFVICQVETDTEEMAVAVSGPRAPGDIIGAIANYLANNKFFYATVEDSGPDSVVKLYKRGPGGDTLLRQKTIAQVPSPGGPQICLSEDSFTVLAGEAIVYVCDPGLYDGGLKSGVFNGASQRTEFSSFEVLDYRGTDGGYDGNTCCLKQCRCEERGVIYCIPRTLTLTFSAPGPDNGCGYLDGETITLTWSPENGYWISPENTDASMPACMQGLNPFWWVLECVGGPCAVEGATYTLRTSIEGDPCTFNDDNQCLWWESGPLTVSCDPFALTFTSKSYGGSPGFPAAECGCCDTETAGSYTFTITE